MKKFKYFLIATIIMFSNNIIANETEYNKRGNILSTSNIEVFDEINENVSRYYGEKNKSVMFIFQFTCGFCQKSHDFIDSWGKSIPSNLKYELVPLIDNNEVSWLLGSAYMYVEKNKSLRHKEKFVKVIYKHVNKINDKFEMARLVKEALSAVGVDHKDLVKEISNKDSWLNKKLRETQRMQMQMKVQYTPTVIVGGRYKTHIGVVKGDTSKFIDLLNGITSMHIQMQSGNLEFKN